MSNIFNKQGDNKNIVRKPRNISKWISATLFKRMILMGIILVLTIFFTAGYVTYITYTNSMENCVSTICVSDEFISYHDKPEMIEYYKSKGYDYERDYAVPQQDHLNFMVDAFKGMSRILIIDITGEVPVVMHAANYKDYTPPRDLKEGDEIPFSQLPPALAEQIRTGTVDTYYNGLTNDKLLGVPAFMSWDQARDKDGEIIGVVIGESSIFNVLMDALFITGDSGLMFLLLLLLIIYFTNRNLQLNVVKPVEALINATESYEKGNYELDYAAFKSDDELYHLATSFDEMSKRIEEYTKEVAAVAAEKEKQQAEMNIAMDIQNGNLPVNFEEFCEGKPFSLFAHMDAAKEVGGDFYDYFMIGEDRVCLLIADVAGKGIPGAMFMLICSTIVKNTARHFKEPNEILNELNLHLQDNKANLFVTIWIGIYDLKTNKLRYSNAGHEYPIIYKKNEGKYTLEIEDHDIACGIFEYDYAVGETELLPGDRIFVYTDGIPEAANAEGELFGNDRMMDAINSIKDTDPELIIENMRDAVTAFTKGAEQSDDLTCLCFVLNDQ
ncbi:MAG: SpoIIE family protein phosphatase [Lachnospiraceae bacterium]|nr:SpoIIE family protein phosphatase [Lachnospiraceae bacterium]